MGAILEYILIFILIYYILKALLRLFAPMLAKKMMDKASKNFEEQFNNPYYKEKPKSKEGETFIEKKPQEKKQTPKSNLDGEYVDYEEVD